MEQRLSNILSFGALAFICGFTVMTTPIIILPTLLIMCIIIFNELNHEQDTTEKKTDETDKSEIR